MLQRITARGRASWRISGATRNCSKSLFTSWTKTDVTTRPVPHTATGRGEAGWVCRPRAMMSSNSAGPPQVSETRTYLDDFPHRSSPDINLDRIKSTMTCTKFHDSTWGFVVRHTRLKVVQSAPH